MEGSELLVDETVLGKNKRWLIESLQKNRLARLRMLRAM